MKKFKFETSTSTNGVAQYISGGHDLGGLFNQMNKMMTKHIIHIDSQLNLNNYKIDYAVVHSRDLAMVGKVTHIDHHKNIVVVRNCKFISFTPEDMDKASESSKSGRYIVVRKPRGE
jgi:hypothetical protein